jgi:hypothetical protein
VDEQVWELLRADDLEGLADLMNTWAGSKIVEVDEDGIGIVKGFEITEVQRFRRLAREDPAAALNLVRGPPSIGCDSSWPEIGYDSPWAEEARKEFQAEIVATAHSACRLDPAHAADYLRQGLTGAPADTSLWISLFDVAIRGGSRRALDMAYGWAEKTYATGGDGTVPAVVRHAYERRCAELL